jgi:hypothetical protein
MRTLTREQARNLLITDLTHGHRVTRWPQAKDRQLLHEACDKKAKKVTFTNGHVFNLRYDRVDATVSWGEYEVVFAWPDDGSFVPCGWFHIKFLLKED